MTERLKGQFMGCSNHDDDYEACIQYSGQAPCDPPEGWQMVPGPGTTGEMDDAVRAFLMILGSGGALTYERARSHCIQYHGPDILDSWPEYAREGSGHIPKAAQADLLYRMMTAAAPKPGEE